MTTYLVHERVEEYIEYVTSMSSEFSGHLNTDCKTVVTESNIWVSKDMYEVIQNYSERYHNHVLIHDGTIARNITELQEFENSEFDEVEVCDHVVGDNTHVYFKVVKI